MTRSAVFAILLAACGASHAPPSPGTSPALSSSPKTDGTEGAVCGWGHRNPHPDRQPAACAAGLQCCYPCGIDGCDSVCEAVTECPELP